MAEEITYELIDITFELPYELQEAQMVREDGPAEEKPAVAEIEYDADGIPMGGSQTEKLIRREKIHSFIQAWRAKHAEKPYLYNRELNEYIKVNQVFLLESVAHSAVRYKSTKAVLMMEEVVANAKKIAMTNVKEGNSNQKPFEKMLVMQYKSLELGSVKMTVGVRKRTQEKVQYSITVPDPNSPFLDNPQQHIGKSQQGKRKKHP